MPALNALLLGSLLYRSRLVPRILPIVGLIGAPLLLASDVAVLFGLWDRISAPSGILATPDRGLGVLPRRLPGRQRLQTLPHHRRHDHRPPPTRPPGRRRLAVDDSGRAPPRPGRKPPRPAGAATSPTRYLPIDRTNDMTSTPSQAATRSS